MADFLDLFLSIKESIEKFSMRNVKLASGDSFIDRAFDQEIVKALSCHYDDLDIESLATTHIPPSRNVTPAIGFSSLVKWSHIILDNDAPVGKVVVTAKRNHSAKIGPIFISPTYRQKGNATLALQALVSHIARFGDFQMVFASMAENNTPARRAFEKAGFKESHRLQFHYNDYASEIVYIHKEIPPNIMPSFTTTEIHGNFGLITPDDSAQYLAHWTCKYFFPIDRYWLQWLTRELGFSGKFDKKPHDIIFLPSDSCKIAALLIYKRNGILKVVLAHDTAGQNDLAWIFKRIIERTSQFRKVSLFLPSTTQTPEITSAIRSLNAIQETIIPLQSYSLYDSILIYSIFT